MDCSKPYQCAHVEYVRLAILALRKAKSTNDLIQWWFSEKDNRDKYRLSAEQWPGLDLKEEFEAKRKELRHANL